MKIKVLVTGGAGFIGSHIVNRLVESNHQVAVLDNLVVGDLGSLNPEARLFQIDLTEDQVEKPFDIFCPEIVIHHGGHVDVGRSMTQPLHDASTNVMGSLNLLEQCKKYGVRKIIYASSAAVYGNPVYLGIDEIHPIQPISNYGISKYVPELYIRSYAQNYGLDYTILRYANVYGPRKDAKSDGSVITTFISRLLNGKQLLLYGDGKQTRDFVYIDDVVDANIMALDSGSGKTINISSSTQTSLLDLIEILQKLMGEKIDYAFSAVRSEDIRHSYLLNKCAYEALGWYPKYSLEDGLDKTIKQYRELGNRLQLFH